MLGKITNLRLDSLTVDNYEFSLACNTHSTYVGRDGTHILVATNSIPIEVLFTDKKHNVTSIYKTYPTLQGTFNIETCKFNVHSFNLQLIYSLSHGMYSLVELYSIRVTEGFSLFYNWASFKADMRITSSTLLRYKMLVTPATQLPNASWLEREVSEFSSIQFGRSRDTRRLLTDYLIKKSDSLIEYSNFNNFSTLVGEVGV